VNRGEADGDTKWFSKTSPLKVELFQSTRMPPEAPTEGIKSKQSKHLGANFLMKDIPKPSLFVWRQIIEQALSSILSRIASHLSEPFIPLMFQHRIRQLRVFIVERLGKNNEPEMSSIIRRNRLK